MPREIPAAELPSTPRLNTIMDRAMAKVKALLYELEMDRGKKEKDGRERGGACGGGRADDRRGRTGKERMKRRRRKEEEDKNKNRKRSLARVECRDALCCVRVVVAEEAVARRLRSVTYPTHALKEKLGYALVIKAGAGFPTRTLSKCFLHIAK